VKEYTTEQLEAEIERRKKEANKPPKMLQSLYFARLQEICKEYIDYLHKECSDNGDFEQYIFEAALEVFYGEGVWTWINEKMP
jgi:hypothetical protein